MNWIRIAVGITRDPRVIALSEAVGVSVPTATGHVVGLLTALPEGSVSGDLSGVSDVTLEQWALWRGKRGVFAKAFRSQLCDEHGVVRSWAKYNGSKLGELAADRERKKEARRLAKEARLSAGLSGTCPPDTSRTSGGIPPLRDETRRDETNNKELQVLVDTESSVSPPRKRSGAKSAGKPASEKAFPYFGGDDRARAIAAFGRLGNFNAGRIINAVGFAYRPASDPEHIPHEFVSLGVEDYCGLITKGRSAPFASPENCAKILLGLARNCYRYETGGDPVARADANMLAIHGHKMAGAA
jgi:hypothetical protein